MKKEKDKDPINIFIHAADPNGSPGRPVCIKFNQEPMSRVESAFVPPIHRCIYRRRETIFERERKARARVYMHSRFLFFFFFFFFFSRHISFGQTGVRFFSFFFFPFCRESNEATCYWPGISTPSQKLANRRSFFLLANRIKSVWCGAKREKSCRGQKRK